MYPIILCSILALAIIVERLWALRVNKISPRNLIAQVWGWVKNGKMDGKKVKELRDSSPLGRVLATGLINAKHGRDIMKEAIVDTA
ncbi:MAG TPA: biopolymer transporter ExbB, partial [Gammaproteobacteria bacterium]|nr:biopolymer transporter ExbB [Gammaproteobacteria bacterium]